MKCSKRYVAFSGFIVLLWINKIWYKMVFSLKQNPIQTRYFTPDIRRGHKLRIIQIFFNFACLIIF